MTTAADITQSKRRFNSNKAAVMAEVRSFIKHRYFDRSISEKVRGNQMLHHESRRYSENQTERRQSHLHTSFLFIRVLSWIKF